MQMTVTLNDLNVQSTVSAIESLQGEAFITLPIAVIPKGSMSNRTYLRVNFNYIIKELIRASENHKERKRYRTDIEAIQKPAEYTPPEDLLTIV